MKLPIFARGSTEKIALAIQKKILTYPSYIMNTDTNMYGFLDDQGTITYFKGNNKNQVVRVDELPPVEEGDTETLYIVGSLIYSFDGESYVSSYKDIEDDLAALTERVEANEISIADLDTRLRNAGVRIGKNETDIAELKQNSDAINQTVNELNQRVEVAESSVADMETRMDRAESVLETHRGRLDTIDTAIEGLDTRVDVVEDQIALNNQRVETLTTRINEHDTQISGLNAALATTNQTVQAHTDELALHDSAISHLTGEVGDMQQDIDEMKKTGGTIVIDDGSGTPETVTVVDYVDQTKSDSIEEAKRYTDAQIQINFV